ncbi:MAG TPA: hypothetical protein VKU01_01565 [Bryobacteraceae bacterium]|nr:hypothetical protein [Bryobacteraceae bacterium]
MQRIARLISALLACNALLAAAFAATTSSGSAPSITSLSPGFTVAGGPAFPLIVTGSNFQATTGVFFGGTPLATTFVTASQLDAVVPANLIAVPGAPMVTMVNPDGQRSNSVAFSITGTIYACGSLRFSGTVGGVSSHGNCSVSTSPAGGLVVVSSINGNGLSAAVADGTLYVAANPAGLAAGTYNGSITLSAGGCPDLTVSVTFTIVGATVLYAQQGPQLFGTPATPYVTQGLSVAISADGNTLIVGTLDFIGSGGAYIFTRTRGQWSQQGPPLIGSPAIGTGVQGASVALSEDGNTAIIGAPFDNNAVGAAWIWTRSAGQWTQQAKLVGDAIGTAHEGSAVALSADGNTAAIGGFRDNNDVGAVWVWTRNGTQWTQKAKLVGTGATTQSRQGDIVSLSADGTTLIESAGTGAGEIWVFALSDGVWTQQGDVFIAPGNLQGFDFDVSADGNTAIILSAPNPYPSIWTRSNGQWTLATTLQPVEGDSPSFVAISGDGHTAAIGSGSGFWVFTGSGSSWVQQGGKQEVAYSEGVALVISNDGSTIATGGGGTWVFVKGTNTGPAPVIADLSPNSRPAAASGGFILTVDGANFLPGAVVQFGGTPVVTSYVTPTQLTAVVSSSQVAAAGTPSAVVINPDGTRSNAATFSVLETVTSTCATLNFSATVSGQASPPQVCGVGTVPDGGAVTVSQTNGAWLSAAVNAGVLTATANPTGLAAGTYTGSITLAANGFTSTTISVSFLVVETTVSYSPQTPKLVGTPQILGGEQGYSVAISDDGNTAVVGAPANAGSTGGTGGAFVFVRSGNGWTQQGPELVGSSAIGAAAQGFSVAISRDGQTILIGGPNDNNGAGAAWVFIRSGAAWTEQAKLIARDSIGVSHQGYSVALSGDGTTAAIGGPYDNHNIGAVWVWIRGAQWGEEDKLVGGDYALPTPQNGFSVALSADGYTLMEGGIIDQRSVGDAWFFVFSHSVWQPQGIGHRPDAGGSPGQGISVALSADGNTAIMSGVEGSPRGVGLILTRANGQWTQRTSLFTLDGGDGVPQPTSVALSGDGSIAIVGGASDISGAGAVWIFTGSGGLWIEQGSKLLGAGAAGVAGQGSAVSISGDGGTLLWGGPLDNAFTGAAWIDTIVRPGPVVTGLSPSSTAAGGAGFTLTLNGANFAPGAVVKWNNAVLVTTFVSANQVTAAVPASLIASVGAAAVTVVNPDQQVSGASSFSIAQPSFTVVCVPPALSFAYTIGGAAPGAQTCSITSTPSGLAVTANSSSGWVSTSLSSASTPTTLSVSINTNGLAAGFYQGLINLSSPGAASSSVPVALTVITGGAAFALSPGSTTIGGGGGTGSVSVIASISTAPWQAMSAVNWITIASGSSGTGNGTVNYVVGVNSSTLPRTGTITIAGIPFAITQAPTNGLGFYNVTPCRVVDTRRPLGPLGGPRIMAGSTRDFAIAASACGIPTSAKAYSFNVTAVPSTLLSYLTIWPAGQSQPYVSTLNSPDGVTVANAAIVPTGNNGAVSVFASDETDVIIDINGYFAPPDASALAFHPVTPCRVADTRSGQRLAAGEIRPITVSGSCGIPANAQAFALNMTVLPVDRLQFLTTWPAGQSQPTVSTLNATDGRVVANAAIVPAGPTGAINVFASDATDLAVDINGYFALSGEGSIFASPGGLLFYPTTPCRIADTRGAAGTFGGPQLAGASHRDFPIPASGCGLPASAQAYSLNMTVVPPGPMQYLTVWPQGSAQPYVSTLNSYGGKVVANAALVPAGINGGISVFVSNPSQVVIDTNGYFAQ